MGRRSLPVGRCSTSRAGARSSSARAAHRSHSPWLPRFSSSRWFPISKEKMTMLRTALRDHHVRDRLVLERPGVAPGLVASLPRYLPLLAALVLLAMGIAFF